MQMERKNNQKSSEKKQAKMRDVLPASYSRQFRSKRCNSVQKWILLCFVTCLFLAILSIWRTKRLPIDNTNPILSNNTPSTHPPRNYGRGNITSLFVIGDWGMITPMKLQVADQMKVSTINFLNLNYDLYANRNMVNLRIHH
jgi:hypothetical protein